MQTEVRKKRYRRPSLTVYGSMQFITREATQNWTTFDANFPAGTPVKNLTFIS